MARSSLSIVLDQKTPINLNDKVPKAGRPLLRKVIRHLEGVLGGVVDASHITIQSDGAQPLAASGTITIAAGANAADTISINGQAITAANGAPTADQWDMSGNNIAECTSLAAAINSTATSDLIRKHVEASNWAGSVALSTCPAGTRIEIAGHVFTAVATSANVLNVGDFSISGTDTADGTALVNAINAHPVLSHQVFASNASGTVTIRQKRGTAAIGKINCVPLGSQTVTQFAATNVVLVSAQHEGHTGNAITLAESTAGARIAVSAARLTGGAGTASGTTTRIVMGASSN